MRDIFTAELTALGEDLTAMSRLVETAISSASTALLTADLELAESVIADDLTIDAQERELDERCVLLIAQQQPVASDLRVIVSGLRISASLERMGDLAQHIADIARLRYPATAIPEPLTETFTQMAEAAVSISRKITTVIEMRDVELARTIEAEDDVLDRLHDATFDATTAAGAALTGQQTVDITLAARYYERFGDHAVAIASRVIYLVTGELGDAEAV
ncbi:phosphate signaling complex protein PhoU [Actinotalea sp.]|uniref:phosphate signaling complex protein PhoU n=1 Tax=Actinotalea sp. TaxID=1872145 RepID=UPI003568C15D